MTRYTLSLRASLIGKLGNELFPCQSFPLEVYLFPLRFGMLGKNYSRRYFEIFIFQKMDFDIS